MASSPLVADISPLVQSLQQFTPKAREDRAMQLAGLERTADIENAALEQQQLANRRNQITTLAQEMRANLIGDRTDLQLVLKDGPNGLMNNLTKLAQKKDITPEEIKDIVTMSNQAIKDPEGAFKSLETNLEGVSRYISSVNEILSGGQTKTPFQKTGSFLVRNEDKTTGIATGVFDPNTGSLRTETTTFGPNQVVSRLGETAGEESTRKVTEAGLKAKSEADVKVLTAENIAARIEAGKLKQQLKIRPKIASAVKLAESKAAERGEVFTDFIRMNAALPGLKEVVLELKELSTIATSTFGGKLFDQAVKQTGFGSTKGSTARAKFISIIDNQVLPLLKPTFGAAFTVPEGESLKATLGNPDATPEEKMATLNTFIAQKERDIRTKKAQLDAGEDQESSAQETPGAAGQGQQIQEGQTATGPNGEKIQFTNGQWVPVGG